MKKNITINLLGRLYAIDEDAYELLKRYTDSLHSYFSRREGGEEIADDIEARIAELFDELKAQGTEAITIEHVQDIIHRVGSPEEMEESPLSTSPVGEENPNEPEGNTSSKAEAGRGPRRLYRNMADLKFMGVLSGFSAYFGGDVLWWRIDYVVLFFLSMRVFYWPWNWYWSLNATLIVAYIVLGILMPVAETPEDRLRMKGKDVTPQNLADEVSQPQSNTEQSGHLGCIGGFFFMVGTLIRWFFYFVAIMIAFGLLSGIVGLLAAMLMPHSVIQISDSEFWKFFDGNYKLLIGAAIAALITLLIPAYCIIHSLFNEFKLLQPMGFRQRFVLLITWLIAFVVTAVIGMGLVGKVKIFDEMRSELRDKKRREENTHDGIYYRLGNYEYDFLTERGWRVTKAEDCNGRYTSDGLACHHDGRGLLLQLYPLGQGMEETGGQQGAEHDDKAVGNTGNERGAPFEHGLECQMRCLFR